MRNRKPNIPPNTVNPIFKEVFGESATIKAMPDINITKQIRQKITKYFVARDT